MRLGTNPGLLGGPGNSCAALPLAKGPTPLQHVKRKGIARHSENPAAEHSILPDFQKTLAIRYDTQRKTTEQRTPTQDPSAEQSPAASPYSWCQQSTDESTTK